MSVLKVEELQQVVKNITQYGSGAQLQDIILHENYLFLQHHLKGTFTLGLELRPLVPRLGYFFGELPSVVAKKKNLIKPIVLFLRAHARNLRLIEAKVEVTLGRVVEFIYMGSEDRHCKVEFRLIPHGMNVIVSTHDKSISLFPVKALPPSSHAITPSDTPFEVEVYLDEWMKDLVLSKGGKNLKETSTEELEKKRKKEIHKKETLIEKLEQDLLALNKPWSSVGEFLKGRASLEVPDEWVPLLDEKLSVNANMQLCFEKHKNQERRQAQIQERIQYLKNEIQALKSEAPQEGVERSVRSVASELLGKAKAKGRKLKLADDIEAVFGKSAKDNLALLRKAQAWDLWLHLRDLPGAHLIVRRSKHKVVDHALLLEAARWLLSETLGKKKVIEGDRYDVIVTECRYVKPIKGDRLGRVTFQNESTLSLRINSEKSRT